MTAGRRPLLVCPWRPYRHWLWGFSSKIRSRLRSGAQGFNFCFAFCLALPQQEDHSSVAFLCQRQQQQQPPPPPAPAPPAPAPPSERFSTDTVRQPRQLAAHCRVIPNAGHAELVALGDRASVKCQMRNFDTIWKTGRIEDKYWFEFSPKFL